MDLTACNEESKFLNVFSFNIGRMVLLLSGTRCEFIRLQDSYFDETSEFIQFVQCLGTELTKNFNFWY